MSLEIVSMLLFAVTLMPSARAHDVSCAPSLVLDAESFQQFDEFRTLARTLRTRFDEGGRTNSLVKSLRGILGRELAVERSARLCAPIAAVLEELRLVEVDGPLVLDLASRVCSGDRLTKRRLVAHALGVLADTKAEPARRFVARAVRDEFLTGQDWREVLSSIGPRAVASLAETLARDGETFEDLHFPAGERVELARRLVRLELPLARIAAWTGLRESRLRPEVESSLSPMQWLDVERRAVGAADPEFGARFESRARAWTGFREPHPGVDVRQPFVDAILDSEFPLGALEHVARVIEERWPAWSNDGSPALPPFSTKGLSWEVLRRAEHLRPQRDIDPKTYRRESRLNIEELELRLAEMVRDPGRSALEIRDALESPFAVLRPHVEDLPRLFRLTKASLAVKMARATSADEWITLAQTKMLDPFDGRMRNFVGNHLPDFIRAGEPDLRALDLTWARPHWNLADVHADNPRSVLGLIRALRDSVVDPRGLNDSVYRTDRALMNAAVDRLLEAPRIADELMRAHSDDLLISALRDSLSWTRRADATYFRRADLRPAVITHVQRAMLIYLVGRSKAGQTLRFERGERERFDAARRIAEASGQRFIVLLEDSGGCLHVRVERAPRR